VYADNPTVEQLTATLERHPNKIMLHDLIYVRLTLENKTDSILKAQRGAERDFSCFIEMLGDNNEVNYFYPFAGGMDFTIGEPQNVLPKESFVPVNIFLEFPEVLTLKDFRTEQDTKKNTDFIKRYVDAGKKCKLRISITDTGSYDSNEIEINSRPEKEMASIKKWSSQFNNFLAYISREAETSGNNPMRNEKWAKVPTIKDYENFESQLSDGTLKNYIKFRRLLASIPNDNGKTLPTLETTKPFRDLGDYLDTLHPLERGCLILSAMTYFASNKDVYSNATNPNHFKMMYLLIPKLPKLEREKYVGDIKNTEYKKILLNSPEPKLK
jgi:hypothetical protein